MLDKLISPFREFGASGLVYVIDRVLRRAHPRLGLVLYDLMAQPISSQPLLPAGLARNLGFRELAPDDPEVASMQARPEIKAQRFAQGATALGVFHKQRLIGYIWLCSGQYMEDEVRCLYTLRSPAESVFDFDLVVLPDSRMGLGFAAVWHCANQYLAARGVRTTFSRVTRFNQASLRAHRRLGAQRLGTALFLQAGALQIMFASLPPYFALSVHDRGRPRIALGAPAGGLRAPSRA